MTVLMFVGAVVLGYLVGAIPSGVIVGRLSSGIDVREHGSGSMGTTNVLRTAGASAAVLVLAADMLKGAVAVGIAWGIFASRPDMFAWGLMAGGMAAIVGHNWPVYIGFRGGRGVATSFGALLLMSWPAALICLAVFIAVVAASRYVSLGSLLAALALLILMIVLYFIRLEPLPYLLFAVVVVPIVVFRHRGNIKRLLSRTESKLGQKVDIS